MNTEQLIKTLEEANLQMKETLALMEEIKRDLLKLNGEDELWGSDRDNQNGDSNMEREQ